MQSHTTFPTTNGTSYIKRLCTHFAHKISVEHTDQHGIAHFAMGTCTMHADAAALRFTAEAADQAALDQIQAIITSHLERFAFREQPALVWQPTAQAD